MGPYTNEAMVTGNTTGGTPVVHVSNQVLVTVPPEPAFTIEKLQKLAGSAGGFTTTPVTGVVGAKVEYEIVVKNTGNEPLRRAGVLMRLPKPPAPIKRIGHGVLGTPKVRETVQWFRETLGFICSDDVYAGEKENIIGSFNRCDRGDEYVDHHTLFCVTNERAGLNHMSFEVPDVDAVFMDHEYLARLGKYEHMWGVGRHLLGSQVYDYWCDPWGRVHERWADTDRLNARSGSNLLPAHEALVSQWGEDPPEKFIRHVSP